MTPHGSPAPPPSRPTYPAWSARAGGRRRRFPIALAALLTTLAALALTATPALAANQTLKVTVTGPGSVNDSTGAIVGCEEAAGTCEASYEEGTVLTLFAGHNERTAFAGWEGCETPNGAECTLTIGAAPAEVKAEFEALPQQTLKVSATGPGTVTGTSPGGEFTPIECGNGATTCEATYNEGATVILFANHNERTAFAGWTDCPNALGPTECEVVLAAATEVKAEFTPIPQEALTVANPGTGAGAGTITGTTPGLEFIPIDCGNGATTCTETYNQGATVTLTADHNERSTTPIVWTGCTHVPSETECEVEMTEAKSVEATFTPIPQQALTVASTGLGAGTVTGTSPGLEFIPIDCGNGPTTCAETYNQGAAITLTATANERSVFAGWGESECKSMPSPPQCEVEMSAARSVDAEFVPIAQQTLTVVTEGTGTVTGTSPGTEFTAIDCGATCEAEYNEGAKLTLTAAPANERTAFTSWTGCTHASGTTCEVTISAAKEVKAKFTPIAQEKLKVETEGEGTLTGSQPGGEFTAINCVHGTETCEAQYNEGAKVTLTAAPADERTAFAGWTTIEGRPGTCTVKTSPCEVTLGEAVKLKAKFTPIAQEELKVEVEGPGTIAGTSPGGEFTPIECGGACEATYNKEAKITLTAAPADERTAFSGWSTIEGSHGSCEGTTSPCEVTLGEATKLKAKFTEITQEELTVATEGTGEGTVTGTSPGPEFKEIDCGNGATTCAEKYNEGAKLTLTATPPNERTSFAGWSGACSGTGTCEVEMTAAKTVKAEFAAIAQETLTVETEGEGTLAGSQPGGEFTPINCVNGTETCTAEYNQGATITLTANPATHSKFTGWENCPHVISTNEYSASDCEVEMTAAETVKANFTAIPQANLEVEVEGPGEVTSSPSGIACPSGTCAANFDTEGPESNVNLTESHNERTSFAGWSGACAGTASTCKVEMSAAKSVKATFTAIPQQELKVETEGEGTVTGSQPGTEFTAIDCVHGTETCEATYNEGATITLTATAAPDNHFKQWLSGPCAGQVGTECAVTMSAAQTAKAEFVPTLRKLTVENTGPGEVTGSPSIACGATCTAEYQEGSTVILTAAPAAHNHVAWSGCTKVLGPDENECKVKIGASDAAIGAAFSVNLHTLTVAPTGPGSLSASPGPISECTRTGAGTCSGQYGETSTVTITATPAPHYHLQSWGGECSGNGPCEVTIGTSPAEVSAEFAPNTQTLTVAPTGQGSVRAASGAISHCSEAGGTCAGTYIEAATVTLFASPGPHQAVSWQGCTAVPTEEVCEVEIPAAAAEVKATFSQVTHPLYIAKAGSGSGLITCNGAPCAASYPDGTQLTILATPAAGSTFAGWSGEACSGTGACHLTLNVTTALTATFDAKPPPVEEKCVVPALAGKTLAQARSALSAAHCTLGTVTKPKKKKGRKLGPLVVKSSSPAAGTVLPAAGKVNLKLGTKAKKKH